LEKLASDEALLGIALEFEQLAYLDVLLEETDYLVSQARGLAKELAKETEAKTQSQKFIARFTQLIEDIEDVGEADWLSKAGKVHRGRLYKVAGAVAAYADEVKNLKQQVRNGVSDSSRTEQELEALFVDLARILMKETGRLHDKCMEANAQWTAAVKRTSASENPESLDSNRRVGPPDSDNPKKGERQD